MDISEQLNSLPEMNLFYIDRKRFTGSTGTTNEREAVKMEARKRVAAENGTVVMDATKNPYVVMQGMGHEELDTTMLYMHNNVMQLKAVIDKRNDSKVVP